MGRLPKLALVGRPNVGKSAIFNRIAKQRIAIVDEAEGITRDRLYAEADCFGRPFEVIDTGGIDPRSEAPFNEQVKRQAEIAIEEADTLVLVVDAQLGITDLDLEVARLLQKTQKPLCVAVNKIDGRHQENLIHEFHQLGISKMIPVSATQNLHMAELLEVALKGVEAPEEEEADLGTKIAIVGRPNVGKSTLVNHLLHEERCIASPIPGTTRDSIDISFQHQDELFTLIDTAGIRRKKAEHEVVDKFAAIRTERAIDRADICLLMLDAQQGMTHQDKRIARAIEKAGKGMILLFNKWDLVKGLRMEHCLRDMREEIPFLKYCPVLFLSAHTGRNVEKIFDQVAVVRDALEMRVSTSQWNRVIAKAMQMNHPPMVGGKRLRIYYASQVSTQPPQLIFFVNYPDLMVESYQRYLYNQIRQAYPFTGVPIRIRLRARERQEKGRPKRQPDPGLAEMALSSLEDITGYDN